MKLNLKKIIFFGLGCRERIISIGMFVTRTVGKKKPMPDIATLFIINVRLHLL